MTVKKRKFDPEGSGFDLDTAREFGMERNLKGHFGSVVPTTLEEQQKHDLPKDSFLVLKGASHPTFDKAVQAEKARGFIVVKRGNRYFSIPRANAIFPGME